MILSCDMECLDTKEEADKLQRIYNTYCLLMLSKARSILGDRWLAEDAVQESFVRIAKNLHKIEENDVTRTRGFVLVVTKNIALTMLKKKEQEMPEEVENLEFYLKPEESPEKKVEQSEKIRTMAEILDGMKSEYREILELILYHELKVGKAAKILGISGTTARKRLQRAREELRQLLEEQGIHGEI